MQTLDKLLPRITDAESVAYLNIDTRKKSAATSIQMLKSLGAEIDGLKTNQPAVMESLRARLREETSKAIECNASILDAVSAVKGRISEVNNSVRSLATKLRHRKDRCGRVLKEAAHGKKFAASLQDAIFYLDGLSTGQLQSTYTPEEARFFEMRKVDADGNVVAAGASSASASSSSVAPPATPLLNMIVVRTPDADKAFEFKDVAVWGVDSSVATEIVRIVALGEDLVGKLDSCDAKLVQEKNRKALTLRVPLEADGVKLTLHGHTFTGTGAAGHDPWVFSLRLNVKKEGPSTVPLPGLPAIFKPLRHAVLVLLTPIDCVISKGISLNDLANYQDTQDAATMTTEKCKLVKLFKDQLLFVPFGWFAQFFFVSGKKLADWTHVLHVPLLDPALKDGYSADVVSAIKNYSEAYLAAEAVKHKSWAPRLEVFRTFLG